MDDCDDLKLGVRIAEDDDVVAVGDAAQVVAEFRPLTPEHSRQGCKVVAAIAELGDELASDPEAAAQMCEILLKADQIPLSCAQENGAAQVW